MPELWSLQPTNQSLVVVTNFGLIGRDQDGWMLACEEHIGGILLDVKAAGDWLVALTESGVWLSHDGVCTWEQGPTSERTSWFLDSAVKPTIEGTPELLVLAPDAIEQDTKLERSNGAVFEIVRSLDPDVAFRNLAASSDLSHIFITGYSQGPRTWHLTYSLDAGENWSDVVPSEVDNTGAVMVPKRVDPQTPSRLFLAAQTPSGGGDQVWLFDSTSNITRLLTTLQDNEVLSNIAFVNDEVWVAGRRNGGGSLYRSALDNLEFTRVVSDAPSLACLESVGSSLLTCANDYSYESSFLVAEVQDQGATFAAQMRVPDLVNLRACDDSCGPTLEWLTMTYSPVPDVDSGNTGSGTDSETGTTADTAASNDTDPEAGDETEAQSKPNPKSSGCVASPSAPQKAARLWIPLFGLALWVVPRRRTR